MSKTGATTIMAKRKKVKRLQPWPPEAYGPYQDIIRLHKLLTDDISTSINRGTRSPVRNKFVLEALIDFILEDCQLLEQACQVIIDIFEDKEGQRGQPPKWYTLTGDIQDNASEIFELARKVKPALRANRLVYLVDVYDQMKVEVDQIEALLNVYPYRSRPVALEQAADIVNETWKR